MRAELTLQQRIYLLWTFRNFRQLSTPLLNSRERALVNGLFRNSVEVKPHSIDPSLAVGVVEDFEQTMVPIHASLVPIREVTERHVSEKDKPQERLGSLTAQIEPDRKPVPSSRPRFVRPKSNRFKLVTARLASTKLSSTRFARTFGGLCLCILTMGAWHRMHAVPSTQAHQIRPQAINKAIVTTSPQVLEPAASQGTIPVPAVVAPLTTTSETTVARTSIAASLPVTPTSNSVPIAASVSSTERAIRVHGRVSIQSPALSDQSSDIVRIEASRPPLHYAYPEYVNVRAHGIVSLTAVLDSDGGVRDVRFVSGNRALAPAAVRAIRQWHYPPYLKDGQAVATETNIVISLFSNDAISLSFPPSIPPNR